MQHSPGQERWRESMDRAHRYGIPCLPINRSTNRKVATTMARTIKLPSRSNALTYGDAEVIDVLLSLYAAPDGEAVVIDDATDTEPKARVRCRNMVKLLDVESFTVTVEDLPEDITEEWMNEEFDNGREDYSHLSPEDLHAIAEERGVEVTGTGANGNVVKADLIKALNEWDAEQPLTWTVPGIKCRTHVVPEGDGFLPVLSIKPQS